MAANAITDIVDHSNEQAFTKADGARLEGKVEKIEAQLRMMMAVQIGTFIGIILLFLGILTK